jgi:hypothetical protein
MVMVRVMGYGLGLGLVLGLVCLLYSMLYMYVICMYVICMLYVCYMYVICYVYLDRKPASLTQLARLFRHSVLLTASSLSGVTVSTLIPRTGRSIFYALSLSALCSLLSALSRFPISRQGHSAQDKAQQWQSQQCQLQQAHQE